MNPSGLFSSSAHLAVDYQLMVKFHFPRFIIIVVLAWVRSEWRTIGWRHATVATPLSTCPPVLKWLGLIESALISERKPRHHAVPTATARWDDDRGGGQVPCTCTHGGGKGQSAYCNCNLSRQLNLATLDGVAEVFDCNCVWLGGNDDYSASYHAIKRQGLP